MERGFSETMFLLRRERGLSQRTVAADLHISQALLSHDENGAREPGLGFVCRACDYYGVTADYLLGRSDDDKVNRAVSELHALVAGLKEFTSAAEERLEDL